MWLCSAQLVSLYSNVERIVLLLQIAHFVTSVCPLLVNNNALGGAGDGGPLDLLVKLVLGDFIELLKLILASWQS